MTTCIKEVIFFTLILFSTIVYSHPGGIDSQGGHNNRKTGEYHCHRSPCKQYHQRSQAAYSKAAQQKRPMSLLYNRKDWKHWSDFDGDCMNTRHEMLLEQADGPVQLSPDGCYVSTGLWDDPFSGKQFSRASDLDVDHIIPLKWAHEHGGANWPNDKKEKFANDPMNLLVVDDGLNQQKGAKGPTEWLPPNHAFRCEYLRMWKVILTNYPDLSFKPNNERVFKKQISACQQ